MTGNKRRSIFGIVLVAAVALAGCGGVAEQDEALTGAAVLQATRAAETARTSTNATMTMDDYSMTVEGTGVEDFARQRGSMTLKMRSDGTFPVPERAGDTESEYEMRWFGDVVYMDTFSAFGMPGNKKWVKFDAGEMAGDEDCATMTSPIGLGSATPVNALDVLAANGNVLEDLGTEVVRDESTTHWRIEDPKAPPGCDDEDIGRVILELWTDDDKRARRILVTFAPETPSATTSTTTDEDWFPALHMTMTTDYFDFGAPVSVNEPAENEVADMDDESFTDPTPADYGTPGPWTVAAEGVREGAPWRVWTTKTSTGVRCYDGENTASGPISTVVPDDEAPKHDGRGTICDIGTGSALAVIGGFYAIADITDGGQRAIVGTVVGDTAEVVFADGRAAALTVDPETHIGQWRGTAPAGVVKIKTESGTCQLGFDLGDFTAEPAPEEKIDLSKLPCMGSDLGDLEDFDLGELGP